MTAASRERGADDVPVRAAATVILLRDSAADGTADTDGVEVWLLTRVTGMTFAAGMSVFPGGRVDDGDAGLPFAGGDVAGDARRYDSNEQTMRALIGAAARETFEETGVLLTVPVVDADLSAERSDVEAGRLAFGDLLRSRGLEVDAGTLRPWSRWVTPKGEARRYDTCFFVGALPSGAHAADVTTESSSAGWVPVREAIEQGQRGERRLLPPTMVTLAELAAHDTVDAVLAAAGAHPLEAVEPELRIGEDGAVSVELPDGRLISVKPGGSA